ncbi:hypothetical protein AcV7_006479 [Taiwanofungus camphoratus]|nr:hypothetical protein AcV7_006479 [Antrodia cinnamomea]
MSKVKRKPAPPFPYSPKYPHPDPSDPFAPLKVLRERARAQSTNAALEVTTPSDDSSFGHLSIDREGFLLTIAPDFTDQTFDLSYPPSSADHQYETPMPPRPWLEHSGGYQSDTPVARPLRPPRSRVRPGRESKSYFSDAELPPTPYNPRHGHLDQRQEQTEKPAEAQYHYRRRSRSVFVTRPSSQSQFQDSPPLPEAPPSNAHTDTSATPHPEPKPEMNPGPQYTYDDRQSHGYLFDSLDSDFELLEQEAPRAEEQVTSHAPSHSQLSEFSVSGPTPPMTPDDSLSLSSGSARDRSVSLSPRSLFLDLPRVVVSANTKPSSNANTKDVSDDEARGRCDSQAPPHETPSNIHSADFPILLTPSRPPSPSISPAAAPAPVATAVTKHLRQRDSHTESEPEPEVSKTRLGTVAGARKRDSMRRRLRKTSSVGSSRQRKSNSSLRPATRKASTGSDSSISLSQIRAQSTPAAAQTLMTESAPTTGAPPSSYPASLVHAQGATVYARAPTSHMLAALAADNAGAESDPGPESKTSRFIVHKPRKSLSHVSLGLAALPNVSLGPPPSANTSTASGMTVGTGFGQILSKDKDWDEGERDSREHASMPPVPQVLINSARQQQPEPESAASTLRVAKRYTTFPPIPILDDTEDNDAAEPDRVDEGRAEGEDDASMQLYTALSTFTRPLTPIASRSQSAQSTHDAQLLTHQHIHTPLLSPHPHYLFRPPVLAAPAPRAPTPPSPHPPRSLSPLPPQQSDSPPDFYVSPIPPTEQIVPAPLPLSPPRPETEPPTPLPAPTPRAKSPVSRVPSRARIAQDVSSRNAVPNVINSDALSNSNNLVPSRSRTPQNENKQRRREASREEERQSTYLPVAQLRPQQSQSHVSVQRRRMSTAQISSPVRNPTPPVQVQAQSRPKSPTPPLEFSPQPPPRDRTYRPIAPPAQPPHRSQSPPVVPQFRAQSPPVIPQFRSQSPPVRQHYRVQAPSTQTSVRAESPNFSQSRGPGRSRDQSRSLSSQLTRTGTNLSAFTQAPASQSRRHGTAPSTPIPDQVSPSPAITSYSQPYSSTRGDRRAHSHTPAGARRSHQHQHPHPQQQPAVRFDEYAMPTREQLRQAASLVIIAQNGLRVPFGDLFRDRRTIVCFIRHFWCPNCQDYMYSIARSVDPDALKRAGVDLVIIGVGSPAMIKSYRQIFRLPFALYTDPTLRLHSALGMNKRTQDPGSETERGEYVRHGALGGLAMVVRNALRVGMPVWEKGGDVTQLGGEFVLGPRLSCTYAHRMRTTRSHAPILHALASAGIVTIPVGPNGASRSFLSPEDEDNWMEDRRRSYVRMQAKREKRREGMGEQVCRDDSCDFTHGSDTGSGSVSGCWGSAGGLGPGSGEDQRQEYSEKRDMPRFHVANPDQNHYLPPTPIDEDSAYEHRWDSHPADLSFLDEFERTQDDSYRLTQEALTYSFGKA